MNRIHFLHAVALSLALAVGSFAYQAFKSVPSWDVAGDRGFFQFVAVMLAWFLWRGDKS